MLPNSEIEFEFLTEEFIESQETEEETMDNVKFDIIKERMEFLYDKMLNDPLSKMELIELDQLKSTL